MSIFQPDWDASTEQRWDEHELGNQPEPPDPNPQDNEDDDDDDEDSE